MLACFKDLNKSKAESTASTALACMLTRLVMEALNYCLSAAMVVATKKHTNKNALKFIFKFKLYTLLGLGFLYLLY
jgi:hypothetical protein